MGKIILYANGNSENHGCEALTRTVCGLFRDADTIEYVNDTGTDEQYGIPHVVPRRELQTDVTGPARAVYAAAYKLNWHYVYDRLRYQGFLGSLEPGDVALSIGGDNYCYSDISWLRSLNYWINKRAKTVLLGVSIEPSAMDSEKLRRDLARYALIIARESLTYEALVERGLGDRAVLLPDPAFLLEPEETALPDGFVPGNTVGINISPMIMDYEENQGMAYRNYEELVRHILQHTDLSVALIPHVVWANSDDRVPLRRLYETFGGSSRVCMVEDQNCMRLKYIISKCRFFVGARTHATIAAYSSCVPTLVVGYSVKAKGIAKDLFGTCEKYVIPVQSLDREDGLKDGFRWLWERENEIRSHLEKTVPDYSAKAGQIPKMVENYRNI